MIKLCPCHSGKPYAECCQPYHNGALPQTALLLMRSRYAAYAQHLADYIMLTTHPANPGTMQNREEWSRQIRQFTNDTQFEGLEILAFEDGPLVAFVTFRAVLKQKGRDASFTEKSRFEKVEGRWLYHSGIFE